MVKKSFIPQFIKKKLTLKLLIMFLISLLASLLLSYCLHKIFFQSYYLEHYEKRLLDIFTQIQQNIEDEKLGDIIVELDYSHQVDIIIVDENLRYALTSHNQNRIVEQRLEQELHNLITNNQLILDSDHLCIPTSGTNEPPRLVFIKRLDNDKYCILTHPWETLESNISAVTEFHFLIGALASLIGIIMTLIFSRQFTKPIIEISKVTEGLAELDFYQKITYQSKDELGELANSINILAKKLEEHKKALKNEIEFQKVLSQNMSHELKTPISVMKGYLEGITHGIADTEERKNEYLQIVLKECDRMTELIDCMLNLSKLTAFQEQGLGKEEFLAIDFGQYMQEYCEVLLEQHGLVLKKEISNIFILGNQALLVQAIGNFISNAVKYGDKENIKLVIYADDQWTYLSIFNTGNMVPESEYKRIFDVFYMLDKVRGRESNSHGLGLAVSKIIAELHHGVAYCQREEKGMLFTIKLPKK